MKKIIKLLIINGLICLAVLTFLIANPKSLNAAFVCPNGNCYYVMCSTNSDCGINQFATGTQTCQGNNLYQDYITYTCNNPGSTNSSCASVKNPQLVQTCNNNQKCQVGLWFTGCAQTTNPTNTNNTNQNYQKCIGNSVYWFDSYGNQQGLYQTCGYGQTCLNNSCATAAQPICASHAIKGCVNNSVYWYNSCGTQQDLYQNCGVINGTCQDGQCKVNQPILQPAVKPFAVIYKAEENLIISVFGKKESDPLQWEKNVSVLNNDKIDFLITVKNISDSPINNVLVKADIGNSIEYADNLKVDNIAFNESIISGIDLGTMPSNTAKALSFTGLARSQNNQVLVKITATVNSGNMSDSDFFTVNIEPAKTNVNTAALGNSPIADFFKKWYIWATLAIVLIFLFIIIFRKLSSNV